MSVGLKKYLEEKFGDVNEVGNNWQIDCPFCGSSQKLGFKKSTGQFNCFKCDERGSFKRFQKLIEDKHVVDLKLEDEPTKNKPVKIKQGAAEKYHKALKKNEKVLKYLKYGRGFKVKAIKHFQLGAKVFNGYTYTSIPFWKSGKLVNIKYRALDFKDKKFKWRRIAGGESSIFHDDVCDQKKFNEVYLCEAELDCIALWNAGIPNVIACTVGAKGFKSEWFQRLERFKKIYLVFDTDVDGQEGARKAAKRLGMDRCYNVTLPTDYKDVNEYFWDAENKKQRFAKEDFLKLVKDARRFEPNDVMSLEYALKDLYKEKFFNDELENDGFTTQWEGINRILRGAAKPGELVVVSAPPKVGKTSFVLNWMVHLAKNGCPSFIYECEMNQKRLAAKMVAMNCKDFSGVDEMTGVQIAETNYAMPKREIYFGFPQHDDLTLDNVVEKIKEVVKRYGVRFVCFDNLHFLVRGQNVKDEIGNVTRRFKLLAETLGIVFCLIVHPRKTGFRRMTMDDLKDSSSTAQDMDTGIFMHRSPRRDADDFGADVDEDGEISSLGELEPLTEIKVKSRWSEGGATFLYYMGERSLFVDSGTQYRKEIEKWKQKRKQKKPRRMSR